MLKYKKNTLFSFKDNNCNDGLYLTKYCEWKNCEAKGQYRAPTSRDKLREFRWFCLEHVKLYNKSWDYFKGRTSDEIYNEIAKDATWHRPTSKRVKAFKLEDAYDFIKPEKKFSQEKKLISNEDSILKALSVLGITMPENIEVLKKQYKKLVKKFHPDINKEKDKEYIVSLNEAYSSLLKLFKT